MPAITDKPTSQSDMDFFISQTAKGNTLYSKSQVIGVELTRAMVEHLSFSNLTEYHEALAIGQYKVVDQLSNEATAEFFTKNHALIKAWWQVLVDRETSGHTNAEKMGVILGMPTSIAYEIADIIFNDNLEHENVALCANTMTQLIAHTLAKAFQTHQRNLEDLRSIQFSTQ